jgi:hypothetical protein
MVDEATEEQGHVWVHDGEQSVNLTAEIARLIDNIVDYDGQTMLNLEEAATAILNIPQIRKALDLYCRTVTPEGEIEGRKAF